MVRFNIQIPATATTDVAFNNSASDRLCLLICRHFKQVITTLLNTTRGSLQPLQSRIESN